MMFDLSPPSGKKKQKRKQKKKKHLHPCRLKHHSSVSIPDNSACDAQSGPPTERYAPPWRKSLQAPACKWLKTKAQQAHTHTDTHLLTQQYL